MNCRIDAWLERGKPCIKITDADSGRVCMQWSLHGDRPPEDALHGIVRELFLLACVDRVSRQKGPLPKPGLHGKLNGHPPLEAAEPFGVAIDRL